MAIEVTSMDAVGAEQTSRRPANPVGPPRRWPVTIATLLLTPLAIAGCGWLAQRQGTVITLLSVGLLLIVLSTAWPLCGAGPGACVAVSGFVLMMFIGPALNDYVMDQRGLRYEAVVADVGTYHRKHGDGYTCRVLRADVDKSPMYTVDDSGGCSGKSRVGERVTLVEDPHGWLVPRLGTETDGLSSGMAGTCAGLFAVMEAFILYGRLRRRD